MQSPFVAPHPASYVAHYNNALPQYNPHTAVATRPVEDEKTRVVLNHPPPPNKENLNVFANGNAVDATRSVRELDRFVEENQRFLASKEQERSRREASFDDFLEEKPARGSPQGTRSRGADESSLVTSSAYSKSGARSSVTGTTPGTSAKKARSRSSERRRERSSSAKKEPAEEERHIVYSKRSNSSREEEDAQLEEQRLKAEIEAKRRELRREREREVERLSKYASSTREGAPDSVPSMMDEFLFNREPSHGAPPAKPAEEQKSLR